AGRRTAAFAPKSQGPRRFRATEGRRHAPPARPAMPRPMLSGPREDPQASVKTASVQKPGLFDRTMTQSTQVASADSGNQENFFSRLFKPKSDAADQKPAPQGAALAGQKPASEPRKMDTAKSLASKAESQKPQAPAATAPQPPSAPPQPSQVASAAPSSSLIKGAQPVVPTGSFDSRWAGLQ